MQLIRILGVALSSLLVAGVASAAPNSLSVSAAAAMEGANGLEVFCGGGQTNNVSVETTHPTAETHYKASFLLRPGELQLANSTAIRMAQFITPGGQSFLLFLKRTSSGNWAVNGKFKDEVSAVYVPLSNLSLVVSGSEQTIKKVTVEYQTDSSEGASNGYIKVTRCNSDGVTSCTTRQNLLVNNETLTVDSMKIGILLGTGVVCTGAGAYDFDGFESYR